MTTIDRRLERLQARLAVEQARGRRTAERKSETAKRERLQMEALAVMNPFYLSSRGRAKQAKIRKIFHVL